MVILPLKYRKCKNKLVSESIAKAAAGIIFNAGNRFLEVEQV